MREEEIQVAAFEGGELKLLKPDIKVRETVLALPLTRLISHMVRVEGEANPVEVATPILKALSPFPDEPLAVSCEKVFEGEGYAIYLAAALPESAADDIGEALDAAKLNVVKIDALALGELRGAWGDIKTDDGKRRLVKIKSADAITMFILDGDHPVAIRAVAPDAQLKREEFLLQLEAEDFAGARELAETIELESSDAALQGIADRSREAGTLDALPDSWREMLSETRFKAKLIRNIAIASGIWALVMGILFGVPIVFGYMTDYERGLCRDHAKAYKAVADKKARTEVVQKYSDHARGALEIMKAISDRLPGEITLTSWEYKRGEAEDEYAEGGVRFHGESEDQSSILDFKDQMVELAAGEGEDAENIFQSVTLGTISDRKGLKTFDLDLKYKEESDE